MAVSGRWKLVAAFGAATLALAGCDDATSKDNNATDVDAGGNGGSSNGNNGNSNMDGGAAQPIADLADNVAGDACNSDSDCKGENATCATTVGGISVMGMNFGGNPAPGGYCTGACMDDTNCGAGGVCVGALGGVVPGTCQQACKVDGDCRDKYECASGFQVPEGGIPGGGDAGIPGGGMIPPQPSSCQPKPETDQLADNKAGAACSTDADCGGGTCADMLGGLMLGPIAIPGTAAPGKYCTGACTEDSQCGAGGVCVVLGGGFFGGGAGNCYQACKNDAQCTRPEYTCRLPFPQGMGGMGGGGFGGGGAGGGGAQNIPEVCFPGMDDTDAGM